MKQSAPPLTIKRKYSDDAPEHTRKRVKPEESSELTTIFLGQLPYDTKVEDIVPWLKTILKRSGCAEDIHAVRLAGGAQTNKKFKGFAFVDFKTRKAAKKAKTYHGTLFRGRKVSIEDCKRKEFVESKKMTKSKGAQNERNKIRQLVDPNTVNRLVKEICVSSEGTLSEDEFDSQLKSFLSILPQDVLNAALLSIKKQASKAPPARKGPYFMVSCLHFFLLCTEPSTTSPLVIYILLPGHCEEGVQAALGEK